MIAVRSDPARQIADQYKPAPGSPYRPVLSPPQQIYELQLGWSDCTITHAFAGIDPPRSLVPAAALVPNLTSTSPQSNEIETTSTSSLKPLSGTIEARSTGATRDPPASPAHKVQTTGPRSTPSPSSSSTVNNDPLQPETSFDPYHTQDVETDPRVSKWQTSVSPEALSETHTSSKKAEDSSIRGLPKDRSFTSLANTEVSKIFLDVFQSSRVSSDQRSDIKSTLSLDAIVSDSLPTHEEQHKGVSVPVIGTIRKSSSEDDRGQKGISSDLKTLPSHGSFPQESKTTQGINTAEPGSSCRETVSDSDLSTRNCNPPYQTKGNPNRPFTHLIDDPSGEPASVSNPARNPDVGASIWSLAHAALQSSPYGPLPSEQGEQQSQTWSPSSNKDDGLTPIDMSVSKPSLEVKLDLLTSATLTGPKIIPQTKSDPVISAISIPFKEPSDLKLDILNYSPASNGIHPTNSISNSSTHIASAHVNAMVSEQSPDVTADPAPPIPMPSSDLHSVPADSNALGLPQTWLSNSTKTTIGNQTAPALESSSASTVSERAGASSFTSKGSRGNTTVLPFKGGEERNTISCFTSLLACFGHIILLFLV